ncbi:hypothetical protein CANARDRAFT_23957 [[Candida] arabinofermentans NRRL YB-2248]|uniref:Uncharacterized protein n=1 Tax=[Candida] arabinofermentans NRRL YB-2248 TaxID=983967 RepID=A0A1E4SYG7_9ASCO|nr:hypothetical protein CANARDRAFT_23957 [[Candida] arabinofermentans NRRL YB-2248]
MNRSTSTSEIQSISASSIITDTDESAYFTDADSHFTDTELNDNNNDNNNNNGIADSVGDGAPLSTQVTATDNNNDNNDIADQTIVESHQLPNNDNNDIDQRSGNVPITPDDVISIQPKKQLEPTMSNNENNKAFISTDDNNAAIADASVQVGDDNEILAQKRGYQRDESECHEYYCNFTCFDDLKCDSGENICIMCFSCLVSSFTSVCISLCQSSASK